MIVITEVKAMNVDSLNYASFCKAKMKDPMAFRPDLEDYLLFEEEVVTGTLFHNSDGERVVIAATADVQNIIGLPFECFENQNNEIDRLRHIGYDSDERIRTLKWKLECTEDWKRQAIKYNHMSPWQLIKLAFRRWNNQRKGMIT